MSTSGEIRTALGTAGSSTEVGRKHKADKLTNKLTDKLTNKLTDKQAKLAQLVNAENIEDFRQEVTSAINYVKKCLQESQEKLNAHDTILKDMPNIRRKIRLYGVAQNTLTRLSKISKDEIQAELKDITTIKNSISMKPIETAEGYLIALEMLVDHKTEQLHVTSAILKSKLDQPNKLLRIDATQADPSNIIKSDVANEALKALQKKLKSNKYLLSQTDFDVDVESYVKSLKGNINKCLEDLKNLEDHEGDIATYKRRVILCAGATEILKKFNDLCKNSKASETEKVEECTTLLAEAAKEADKPGLYTLAVNTLERHEILHLADPCQQFCDALEIIKKYQSSIEKHQSCKQEEKGKYKKEIEKQKEEIMQESQKEGNQAGPNTLALRALAKLGKVKLPNSYQQPHDTTFTKLLQVLTADSPIQKKFRAEFVLPLAKLAVHCKKEYLAYYKYDFPSGYLKDSDYDEHDYNNLSLDDPNRKYESETTLRRAAKAFNSVLDNLEERMEKFKNVQDNLTLSRLEIPLRNHYSAQANGENITNLDDAANQAAEDLKKELKKNKFLLKQTDFNDSDDFEGKIEKYIKENVPQSLGDLEDLEKHTVIPEEVDKFLREKLDNTKELVTRYDEAISSLKEPTNLEDLEDHTVIPVEVDKFLREKPDRESHYKKMVILYAGALQIMQKFQEFPENEKKKQRNNIMKKAGQETYNALPYILAVNALNAQEKLPEPFEQNQVKFDPPLTEGYIKQLESQQEKIGPDMDKWLHDLDSYDITKIDIRSLQDLLSDPDRSNKEKLHLLGNPDEFGDLLSSVAAEANGNVKTSLNAIIQKVKELSRAQNQANDVTPHIPQRD